MCVFVCACGLFLLFIQTIKLIEKDFTSTLFSLCKWILFATVLCRWHTESFSKHNHCITRSFSSRALFIFLLWSVTHFTLFHSPSMILHYYFSSVRSITHCRCLFPSVAPYTQLCLCPLWGHGRVWAPTHFTGLTWILTLQLSHAIALLRSQNDTWIYLNTFLTDKQADLVLNISAMLLFFHCVSIKYIFCVCLQLYKEIEICPKATKVIRFHKTESCTIGYGMLVSDNNPQFLTHSKIL